MPLCKRSGCRFGRAGGPAGCSAKQHHCSVCKDASAFINYREAQVNSLFGIVRRVVGQGDPSLTQLLWDRLAHSPQLIAQMEVRLRGPPAPEKRKRNCNSSSSSNISSHSSSASDPAEASSTVIAITPSISWLVLHWTRRGRRGAQNMPWQSPPALASLAGMP
jgi:hypothetical protein